MRPDDPMPEGELALLTADLQAVRPQPDPVFLAALEQRVRDGFPAAAAPPARTRRAWLAAWLAPRRLVPLGGGLALVAVIVTAALTASPRRDETASSGAGNGAASTSASVSPQAAEDSSASSAAQAPAAGGRESAPPAKTAAPVPQSSSSAGSTSASGSAGAAPAAPSADRKVERDAQLTLTPAPDDVQNTADGVVRETQAVGGYVQRSDVATTDGGGSASFTLRIPSARLDDALARLSKLAHVGALRQGATDITAATVSAADRLADARDERQALLKALGRATTDRQIAALQARLRDNRALIAAREADLNALRRRADMATVSVSVEGRGAPAAGAGGGTWTPGDALRDAGRVLEVAGGIALVALAVIAPLALLALLAWLAARSVRRHRRETALNRAS